MSVAPAGVALTGNTPGPESKYRLAPNRNNQWPSRLQILRKVERFNRTLAAEWAYAKPYLSRADLVPCDGDENVGGVRAGRGGRGDLVAADADGDVAERAQGPDDLADAVAGGLLQVA